MPDTAITAAGALIDPSTASREQIAALPGMTPALADSIIARRPIASMLVVDSILGRSLSEAQRDTIYSRMFTPIAINTASDAEILLIPGIGSRMLREFKEYRPYDNIARFRREMGKYVDSTEVARMEKFVKVQ
jgi:DNA uptake protein ComE-like DNA-binding protein